jgi:hypothetical protein
MVSLFPIITPRHMKEMFKFELFNPHLSKAHFTLGVRAEKT